MEAQQPCENRDKALFINGLCNPCHIVHTVFYGELYATNAKQNTRNFPGDCVPSVYDIGSGNCLWHPILQGI